MPILSRKGGYKRDRQKIQRKASPFYNKARWKNLSKHYRQSNPLCECCKYNGVVTPAEHTDHIIEISQGGTRYDIENLQSLCVRCHGLKTQLIKRNSRKLFGEYYRNENDEKVPLDKKRFQSEIFNSLFYPK